ncbi:unnamed protein product, partial [Closterium sp. NIES-53]
GGAGAGGAGAGGTGVGGAGARDPGAGGAGAGGAGAGGTGAGGTVQRRPFLILPPPSSLPPPGSVLCKVSSTGLIPCLLCPPPHQSHPQFQPDSPLPAPSLYAEQIDSLTERHEPASRPSSPVRTGRCVPRPRPPPVPGTHIMALLPSSVPLRVPLPSPPTSSCTALAFGTPRHSPLLYLPVTRSQLHLRTSPIMARYVAPGKHRPEHWEAAKRVLRYLCSTSNMGLVLGGRGPVFLTGHADASWVDDLATQRSSQGYTFSLGSGSVSWRSTRSSSELRWLTYLLTDLGERPLSPPVLYVDNKAMIALCQEHRLEHKMEHITLRYFLAQELQHRGQLRLAYVATRANIVDIFTKALQHGDNQRFCTVLGLLALLFLDWSCDLLFSPTLPMGVCQTVIIHSRPTLNPVIHRLLSLSRFRHPHSPDAHVTLSIPSLTHSRSAVTPVAPSLPSLLHSHLARTSVALSLPSPFPTRCSPFPAAAPPSLRGAPLSLCTVPPSLRAAPPSLRVTHDLPTHVPISPLLLSLFFPLFLSLSVHLLPFPVIASPPTHSLSFFSLSSSLLPSLCPLPEE